MQKQIDKLTIEIQTNQKVFADEKASQDDEIRHLRSDLNVKEE